MDTLSPDYTPLAQDSSQFRLLRLAKSGSKPQHEHAPCRVRCSFSTLSLDDYPDYEALSYVWGDPHKGETILIDDKRVAVTGNLHEALQELQLPEQERTLWVDAVCINQADDTERTHQVSQMRHIYSRASSVVVYLGPAWDGCEEAFEFFERSSRDAAVHYAGTKSPCVEVDGKSLGESDELRNSIGRFFDLTWWKRLWTVQEFVLAKKTVFHCGPHILPEEVLLRSFYHVRIHTRTCCSNTPLARRDPISGLSNWDLFNRIDFLRLLRSWKQTYSFFHTLASFRTRQSYDPRDKIFGLLGLAFEEWASCIKPDYKQSTENIYRSVVTAYVENTGNLEFLSHCYGKRESIPQIPSFIPDWRALVDDNLNANYANRVVTPCFDTSNGAAAEMTFINSSQATFKGLIYDEIVSTGPPAPPTRINATELQCWREFAGVEHSADEAVEDMTEADIAFGATLCGGMGSDWVNGDCFMRRATMEQDWPMFKKWQTWIDSDYNMSAFDDEVARFNSAYVTAALDRRLATTSKGHLAFVPNATAKGDVIAVLAGGKLPYILRLCQNEDLDEGSNPMYTLIGDAYVFGIMDGEMWPEDRSSLSQIRMK